MSAADYRTGLTPAELETRDQRRQELCTMMLSGHWAGSSSRRRLAKEWGCKLADVYQLEGEAAGAVRQLRKKGWPDEAEAMREAKLAELDELIALARGAQKHLVVSGEVVSIDAPAVGVMLKAIVTQLTIAGVLARPGDKAAQGSDDYDRMSHAERAQALREAAEAEEAAATAERQAAH